MCHAAMCHVQKSQLTEELLAAVGPQSVTLDSLADYFSLPIRPKGQSHHTWEGPYGSSRDVR